MLSWGSALGREKKRGRDRNWSRVAVTWGQVEAWSGIFLNDTRECFVTSPTFLFLWTLKWIYLGGTNVHTTWSDITFDILGKFFTWPTGHLRDMPPSVASSLRSQYFSPNFFQHICIEVRFLYIYHIISLFVIVEWEEV